MLRITWEETADRIRFRLTGKLVGEWVREFAEAWARVTRSRKAEVDLQDVTFVDEDGERLLRELHGAGVVLRASRPLTAEIVRCCSQVKQGNKQCLL